MGGQVAPLTSRDVETEVQRLEILDEIAENEPVGMEYLGQATGESPDAIRTSVRSLEESGLITPTSQGAELTDPARELLDDVEMDLGERIEALENGELAFESGVQPRSDELEASQTRSSGSSGGSILDRIRNLF